MLMNSGLRCTTKLQPRLMNFTMFQSWINLSISLTTYKETATSLLFLLNFNQTPQLQYIPRNMHMVFALLCFVVVIHWLIFPYPSGLLHWHCGNLTIAPVPAKQPWWIWINTSCEFIMNDCITTTKQSTTKPCAYFLGYTVYVCVISFLPALCRNDNPFIRRTCRQPSFPRWRWGPGVMFLTFLWPKSGRATPSWAVINTISPLF